MSYIIKVNGEKVRGCNTLKEAKVLAKVYGGKIYGLKKTKLPKAASLRFSDSKYAKSEMFREVCGEINHGYHVARIYKRKGE